MKRYQIVIDGRSFDVQVLGDPREERVQVEVDGVPLSVEVRQGAGDVQETPVPEQSPVEVTRPAGRLAPVAAGDVVAPLPGVVGPIRVEAGQRVAMGDELLVIEAMKMENVIRAPRGGVVETIHVAGGQRVAHGAPLLAYRAEADIKT